VNIILNRFKEVTTSILPIVGIVLFLNLTIAPVANILLFRFLLGALLVIIGLTLFLLGVDIGIIPIGNLTGKTLAKSNNLLIVLFAGIILGFFISLAEPGLIVLANQINLVTSGGISGQTIILVVSIGMALLITFGFIRIFYNIPLYKILMFLYILIFGLAIFSSREALAIAFDASGATTGVLAVPFILALSVGISTLKKDSKASEKDSFGLVAIASAGAIMSVLVLDLFTKTEQVATRLELNVNNSPELLKPFIAILPTYLQQSFFAILPLLVILLFFQQVSFKLSFRELRRLSTGFVFSFLGLVTFLVGVNGGFNDIAISLGGTLAILENKSIVIIVSFVLGFFTILAEPAVYVLTQQIEDVTSGYVKRKVVSIPLAIGVGLAVSLSMIRVLTYGIELWHYLLPGYLVAIGLMFLVPKLFIGIAFDAGGVATGPITATFILAFVQGAASSFETADLITDGFGMIAMVALLPIITLELLGLVYLLITKVKGAEKNEIKKQK
jgi:hypothetical protein